MPITQDQFAEQIKRKYPQYANQPNQKLVAAFVEKFPQYRTQVTPVIPPTREQILAQARAGKPVTEMPTPKYAGTVGGAETAASAADESRMSQFVWPEQEAEVRAFGRGGLNVLKGLAQIGASDPKQFEQMIRQGSRAEEQRKNELLKRAEELEKAGHGYQLGLRLQAGGHGMASVLPFVGPGTAEQAEKASQPGAEGREGQAELLGSFVLPTVAGKGLGAGYGALRERLTPLSAEDAATRISDAVNPDKVRAPQFRQDLAKHLDKVLEFAKRRSIPTDSLQSLTKAMQGAGLELKNYWYQYVLEPNETVAVGTRQIPGYEGKSTGEGQYATLGELDARLVEINNEIGRLRSGKTILAGERAVKSEPQLNAEGNAIRDTLYSELSRRTGIPGEQLRDTREGFGAMRDLATETQLSADAMRQTANRARLQAKTSRVAAAKRVGSQMLGTPEMTDVVDKEIAATLGKVRPGAYRPPQYGQFTTTPQTPRFSARPLGPEPSRVSVEGTTAAEREAQLQKLAQRGQQVQAQHATKAARVGGARLARGAAGAPEGVPFGETEDITEAERTAHAEKVAKRAAEVKAARAKRLKQIAEAKAARRRPPQE